VDRFRRAGRLLLGAVAYLTSLTMVAGAVLAAVEDVPLLDGLWNAFAVVSTTGFGEGPITPAGMLIAMGLFVAAIPGYAAAVAAAMMMARSIQGPVGPSPRPLLVERDVHRVVRDLNRN
jgi:hypothetical protein